MGVGILSHDYRVVFVDNPKYSGRVSDHLAGLAVSIEDSHDSWRPTVSELLSLLPESPESNSIVAAGMAYGSAKAIGHDYPGPAILLCGASLNTIGSAPNVELESAISAAKEILIEKGINQDPDIKELVNAATQRASFDKVAKMLQDEFSQGLRDSGKFEDSTILDIVPKIVNITHDVRHKGLIERITWKNLEIEVGGTSTNAGYMIQIDEIVFVDDELRDLLPYAMTGCAYSILRRLEDRRTIFS